MRKRNSVRQLGRTHAHRKAMFINLVTSFFEHERIVTTREKGKELKRISEKLITKAKRNLSLADDQISKKLHNKREAMKYVNNGDVLKKLFDEIAPRNKERNGGYTRIYLTGQRAGDAAEMAIVELVERKTKQAAPEAKEDKKDKKEKKEKKAKSKE
ncbi:MAG TPA: 50S ribosomal protein L17 [Spirochaetota bacterium]|nr:50S ribosomal protein L17 [Spirochaetota bacterium]HSA15018.1 50S ribosomal protein L17 [Spirochaetota bacterium]